MRLQKYIAGCGFCSRRTAEEWILAGRVKVNGRVAALGESVDDNGADEVLVDGKLARLPRSHTYILLNKPKGYVTTASDEKGRATVLELVEDCPARVFPVGRLDLMSEGLLLLTDDGELANHLMHPSGEVEKTYRVWVRGGNLSKSVQMLRQPITYEGVSYRAHRVEVQKDKGNTAVIDITVSEGKNHEVRNLCAAAGLSVQRLQRIRQGSLELGNLPVGKWRYLTSVEADSLQKCGKN